MPTPSIQTLRADAQQVLNLDSISAVRSVVAATLANANAGTPLNPNLTTQQLWNEFYQIVTQPKSDIESIIANQLMKFLYAPPAPGGVGADKQVIFNDGGVLAGDPQFLWNKTTNLLTVTGSATITGDLTVDTNTLKVDSANNRVGIGTASPAEPLTVDNSSGVTTGAIRIYAIDQSHSRLSIQNGNGQAYHLVAGNPGASNAGFALYDNTATATRWYVDNTGVHTWQNVGGVAGTAMTLNATGLGVGDVPTADCKLTVRGGAFINRGASGGASQLLVSLAASSGGNFGQISNTGTRWALGYGPTLTTVGTEALIWDSSGQVGIGVTPTNKFQVRTTSDGVCQFIGRGGGTNNPNFQVSFADATTTTTINAGSGAGNPILTLATAGSDRLIIDASGNVIVNSAAIATTATDGFLYIPGCAGTPTGTPTAKTGRVPLVVDTTNNKLYFYSGGAWVAAN